MDENQIVIPGLTIIWLAVVVGMGLDWLYQNIWTRDSTI